MYVTGSGNAGLVATDELPPAEGPLPHCPDDDDDDDDDDAQVEGTEISNDSDYEPYSQVHWHTALMMMMMMMLRLKGQKSAMIQTMNRIHRFLKVVLACIIRITS